MATTAYMRFNAVKMINQNLKEYLDDNGIKYAHMANKLNMTATNFSHILKNRQNINVEVYFKICDVLGLPENYLRYYSRVNPNDKKND